MNFNMKSPCNECPFIKGSSTNITLNEDRLIEIADALMNDQSFTCHKTIDYGENNKQKDQEHCAGAMLYLERENNPNQITRIAERIGIYDHTKLIPCEKLIDPIHKNS